MLTFYLREIWAWLHPGLLRMTSSDQLLINIITGLGNQWELILPRKRHGGFFSFSLETRIGHHFRSLLQKGNIAFGKGDFVVKHWTKEEGWLFSPHFFLVFLFYDVVVIIHHEMHDTTKIRVKAPSLVIDWVELFWKTEKIPHWQAQKQASITYKHQALIHPLFYCL